MKNRKWAPPVEVVTSSHYRIAPAGESSWMITVNRSGTLTETIPAGSFPEAVRLSRRLSDNGLIGYIRTSDG